MKVLVVAGTHAGVGKTTFCVGLMGALRQRGLVVQAFKVGPDQLDPLLHEAATGRPSYNLDGYLLSQGANVARVEAIAEPGDVDVAVVEGGESLFDAGDLAVGERGSAGQMAKWLGAPVVLVVDCGAVQSARGVAAVVRGHLAMDDELAVAGVVLNKLESAAHETAVREALRRAAPGVPVLGALRHDAAAAALGPSAAAGDAGDAFAAAAARAAAALGAGGGASIGGALVGLGNFSAEKRGGEREIHETGSPTSEAGEGESGWRAADGRDEKTGAARSRGAAGAPSRVRDASVKTGGSFVAGIAAQLAHVVGEGVDLNAVLGVAWPFVAEPGRFEPAADEKDPDSAAKRSALGGDDAAFAAATSAGTTAAAVDGHGVYPVVGAARVTGAPESPANQMTPKRGTPPSKRGSIRGTLELVGNVASHLGPALRLGRGVGAGASHLLPRPLFAASGCVRVGIARDAAFCHYFRDNLLALERAGAELAPFSPVAGDALPPNCKGLLFGGGYPELYARELANNAKLRAAVTAFAASGGAVYAECGGLAFLSQSLSDGSGSSVPRAACGLAPFATRIALGARGRRSGAAGPAGREANARAEAFSKRDFSEEHYASGYVCVVVREGCPLFPAGAKVRGHVRRRSAVAAEPALAAGPGPAAAGGPAGEPARGGRWFAAYDVFRAGEEATLAVDDPGGDRSDAAKETDADGEVRVRDEGVVRAAVRAIESAEAPRRVNDVSDIGRVEGYAWRNVLASYVRLHFGDAPEMAAHFVDACRAVPQAAAEAAVRAAAAAEAAPPPLPTGRSSAPSLPQLETFEKAAAYGLGVSGNFNSGGSSDSLSALDSGRVDRTGPASPARARSLSATSREHSAASSSADLVSLAEGGLYAAAGALSDAAGDPRGAPPSFSTERNGAGAGLARASSSRDGGPEASRARETPMQGALVPGRERLPVSFHRRSHSEDVDPDGSLRSRESVPGASPRLSPTRGVGESGSGGAPFRRSRSAASFGSQSGSQSGSRSASASGAHAERGVPGIPGMGTNPNSATSSAAAHLELEAFLSFPPVSGSQVGLASLDASGDDGFAGAAAHLHTPAATPQPAPDPECTIASLSPAATEIVHALGLQSRLACVTDRCDYPPTVARAFPIVLRSREPRGLAQGRGRLGGRRESISTAMYNAEKAGERGEGGARGRPDRARGLGGGPTRTASVSVDVEWLRRSRPGLVLAQDACGRCVGGAGDGVVARALAAAGLLGDEAPAGARTGVLALDPQRLGEVLETVTQVGAATGEGDAAAALVSELRARLRATAARVSAAARKPRVLSLEGLRPFAVGGHWLPEMKHLAGGADELQEPGAPAVALRWEQVLSYAPEVLVLAPCVSRSPEETLGELERLAALPGWWAIPAVRDREVYVAHHAFFSRAGPRLVVGVELLAKMLHPSLAADVAMPEGHGAWKMRMDPGKRCRPRQLRGFFHEWKGGGVDGWA